MSVSLQITHSSVKCMHVSNACNTDFCIFIVLGDELLIHCIHLALYLRPCLKVNTFIFYSCNQVIKSTGFLSIFESWLFLSPRGACSSWMNSYIPLRYFHRYTCNIHQSIQYSKVNILSHLKTKLEVRDANYMIFQITVVDMFQLSLVLLCMQRHTIPVL